MILPFAKALSSLIRSARVLARGTGRAALAMSILVSGTAGAADIHVYLTGAMSLQDVQTAIKDLMTDAFAQEFPPAKYSLFVFLDHHRLGNDNVCYALVGLTRRVDAGTLPVVRYSSAYFDKGSKKLSPQQEKGCLAKPLRHAVKGLVSAKPAEIRRASQGRL